MVKNAKFSECGKYRFWLSRLWDESEDCSTLMLIGLNPSTANATEDDPTIRRIIGLAKENGYGEIVMTNLFPFITAYPEKLEISDNQIPYNDEVLKANGRTATDVCFCWGNFDVRGRDKVVKSMFPNALCFGKNKNGSPKHPLYLKSNTKLIPY